MEESSEKARRPPELLRGLNKSHKDLKKMREISRSTSQVTEAKRKKGRFKKLFFRGCSGQLDLDTDESLQKLAEFKRLNMKMSDGGAAAFGEILFNGLDLPVPFMCCDVGSPVADIFRVFVDIWKLKEPSVVLSVTGSTHLVDLDARIEAAFVKGLGLAAVTRRDT